MSSAAKKLVRVGSNIRRCSLLRTPPQNSQWSPCRLCKQLLSSSSADVKPERLSRQSGTQPESGLDSNLEKNLEKEEVVGKVASIESGTGSDVIVQEFKRVTRIEDVPRHELPVQEIMGKVPEVWWESEMQRPSIRERIWQMDPIIQYKEPVGIGKLRKPKRRTVKKAHIETLDEKFVHAYETIGANKHAFESVVAEFKQSSGLRGWGFMEFQYVAMEYMRAFGVERDVSAYNQLLSLYPRGPLRIANYFSEAMRHGQMEQDSAVKVIQQMSRKEAYPDTDTLDIMLDVFGPRSAPVNLMRQLWYWVPKLRNLNPWLVPDPLPSNPLDTAEILLERMGDYDQEFEVLCGSRETADVDPAYLVSSMNEEQMEQLAALPNGSSLTVSGPYFQFITRRMSQQYFVLRGEAPKHEVKPNTDEIEFDPADYEEGYVYALAITGQPDQSMARLWISELSKRHPNIKNMFVTFNLTATSDLISICDET